MCWGAEVPLAVPRGLGGGRCVSGSGAAASAARAAERQREIGGHLFPRAIYFGAAVLLMEVLGEEDMV